MKRHVKGNVSWVGYLDWELEHFHGDDYSIYNGSSQNAYLIEEEKTVLVRIFEKSGGISSWVGDSVTVSYAIQAPDEEEV